MREAAICWSVSRSNRQTGVFRGRNLDPSKTLIFLLTQPIDYEKAFTVHPSGSLCNGLQPVHLPYLQQEGGKEHTG